MLSFRDTMMYFNLQDSDNRKELLHLTEDGQNSVLLGLTSKLYDMIITKTTAIDFGTIPESEGDVTKIDSYAKLIDCINTIRGILKKFKQPTDIIDEINTALSYVERDKYIYTKGFKMKINMITTTYNTIVLSIGSSISYLISVTIDFIKNSDNNNYKVTFNKNGIARTKESLVYSNIVSFNDACDKNQISSAFLPLINKKAKGFVISASTLTIVGLGMAVLTILVNILPIIRELTYFYYASNTRVSQYFDLQADLLEMNAELVKSGDVSSIEDKKTVAERQKYIADKFRKIANFFAVEIKETDSRASKSLNNDNKKYNVNDVVDQRPDSDSLF